VQVTISVAVFRSLEKGLPLLTEENNTVAGGVGVYKLHARSYRSIRANMAGTEYRAVWVHDDTFLKDRTILAGSSDRTPLMKDAAWSVLRFREDHADSMADCKDRIHRHFIKEIDSMQCLVG